VWAAIFLDETPEVLTWLGVAMVIAGGVIAGVGAAGPARIPASDVEAAV
jgi:drug/metabolite transporter (DMT)-like permease